MNEEKSTAVVKSEVELSQLPDVLTKRGFEFLQKYVCKEAKTPIAIQEVQIGLHAMDFNLKDVLRNRCHVIPFYDRKTGGYKFKILVSIHELISRADSTGKLDGIETETDGGDGQAPTWATAIIYRKDCTRPFRSKVYWSEYAEKNNDGKLSRMWAEKPTTMLTKVAISHALHLAFAAVLMNLYATEEFPTETMENGGNGKDGKKEPGKREPTDAEVQDAKAKAKEILDDINERKTKKAKAEQVEDVTPVEETPEEKPKADQPKPEIKDSDKPLPAQIVALQKLAERLTDEKAKAKADAKIKAVKTRADAATLIKDLNAFIAGNGKPKGENGFLKEAKELRKFYETNNIIEDYLTVIGSAGYETEEQVPIKDQTAVLLALQQVKKDFEALN